MQHSTHAPTQSEAQRFAEFHDIGCVVCRLLGRPTFAFDIHHIVEGGRRRGHLFTIPLHPWFHRGLPPDDMSIETARIDMGPSMALHPEAFFQKWESEYWLLNAVNDMIRAKNTAAPRISRHAKQTQEPIQPRQWTVFGCVAVRTRSMSIAQKVADKAPKVDSGTVDGYEFLSRAEYDRRSA
jgi:hypothetical protein